MGLAARGGGADIGLHGAGSGDRRLRLGGLATAAGGVLALAVINFVNLWSVRTLRRQREIGLRKSLGADALSLGLQFFVEALAVAGLAGLLGLLLAWWAEPAVSVLMQHSFDAPVLSPASVALTGLLCVLIAALGALPLTHIALRVRPAGRWPATEPQRGPRQPLAAPRDDDAAVRRRRAVLPPWHSPWPGRRGMWPTCRAASRRTSASPWTCRRRQVAAQTQSILARLHTWPDVIAAAASHDVPGRDLRKWYSQFSGPVGSPSICTGAGLHAGLAGAVRRAPAGRPPMTPDHRAEVAQNAAVLDRSAAALLGFANPEAAIGQAVQVNPDYRNGQPVTIVGVIDDLRF